MLRVILVFNLILISVAYAEDSEWRIPAKNELFLAANNIDEQCEKSRTYIVPKGVNKIDGLSKLKYEYQFKTQDVCHKYYENMAKLQNEARLRSPITEIFGDFDCDGKPDSANMQINQKTKTFRIRVTLSQSTTSQILLEDNNQRSIEHRLHYSGWETIKPESLSSPCEAQDKQCVQSATFFGFDCKSEKEKCETGFAKIQAAKCDIIRLFSLGSFGGNTQTGEVTVTNDGVDSLFVWNGNKFVQHFVGSYLKK